MGMRKFEIRIKYVVEIHDVDMTEKEVSECVEDLTHDIKLTLDDAEGHVTWTKATEVKEKS
jgi:hypothetical protein